MRFANDARTAAPEGGASAARGIVTFRLGTEWLGIPVALIQEVIAGERVTPVPLAPPEVHGFLNLRGQIVTALDLGAVLEIPRGEDRRGRLHVVIREDSELFSLVVDDIGEVIERAGAEFDPVPRTLHPALKRFTSGVIRRDGHLVVVLDAGLVLAAGTARVG